jgi:hypothetical protein
LFARHPTGLATHATGLSLLMIIDVALAAFSDPVSNDGNRDVKESDQIGVHKWREKTSI